MHRCEWDRDRNRDALHYIDDKYHSIVDACTHADELSTKMYNTRLDFP